MKPAPSSPKYFLCLKKFYKSLRYTKGILEKKKKKKKKKLVVTTANRVKAIHEIYPNQNSAPQIMIHCIFPKVCYGNIMII